MNFTRPITPPRTVSKPLIRAVLALIVAAATIFSAASPASSAADDLLSGEHAYGLDPAAAVILVNRTGADLQIDRVTADADVAPLLSEFCLFVHTFATGQVAPGDGESGCTVKCPGESGYQPLV